MSRFQTSWEIAKRSWAVLKSDKTLAWFPVLSALGSLVVFAVIGGLIALMGIDSSSTGDSLAPDRLGARRRGLPRAGDGADLLPRRRSWPAPTCACAATTRTVRGALDIANSRLHRLLPWAIVTATVTMILQAIEERFGIVGRIVAGLVGLAWNLVTFLVVPILVLEDLGVGDALKRSKDMFKQHLGRERHRPGRSRDRRLPG